jgi:hypothetical protein
MHHADVDLSPEGTPTVRPNSFATFKVQDGDQISSPRLYNEQAIYLQGHVLRPGRYSYHDG